MAPYVWRILSATVSLFFKLTLTYIRGCSLAVVPEGPWLTPIFSLTYETICSAICSPTSLILRVASWASKKVTLQVALMLRPRPSDLDLLLKDCGLPCFPFGPRGSFRRWNSAPPLNSVWPNIYPREEFYPFAPRLRWFCHFPFGGRWVERARTSCKLPYA